MNSLEQKITVWLARGGPPRSVNECFDLPIVLATDVGLRRSENQDRVAALKISSRGNAERPLIAVAVVDGMGGMRDGGKCATLALSSFLCALTLHRGKSLEERALSAIIYANNAVFKFAGGKGGATLSSVLVEPDQKPLIVNLGDSRIYAFGVGNNVERLTRDDSLAEAVGGHGRDLLQFVGMGPGMQPHIQSIANTIANLAITTDGIHFIEARTFEEVLVNALDLRSASQRLSALARWCGGPDNASVAMIGLRSLFDEIRNTTVGGIEVWDPFGSLVPIWIEKEAGDVFKADEVEGAKNATRSQVPDYLAGDPAQDKVNAKGRSKTRRTKKSSAPKDDIQLEIQIERSPSPDGSDEDSR